MDWHLLYVRPRFERTVARQLQKQNIEHYLPTFRRERAQSTIELPLFPGYVFCKYVRGRHMPVSLIPGVLSVRDCEHADIKEDVDNLRHILQCELKFGPWSYVETGTIAIAIDGPLSGLNGFVWSENRFIVPIRSVLRSVMVEVEGTCRFVSADSSYESNSAA